MFKKLLSIIFAATLLLSTCSAFTSCNNEEISNIRFGEEHIDTKAETDVISPSTDPTDVSYEVVESEQVSLEETTSFEETTAEEITTEEATTEEETTQAPTETVTPTPVTTYTSAYSNLIYDIKTIIAKRRTISYYDVYNFPNMRCNIDYTTLSYSIFEEISQTDTVDDFGYVLYDMNADGTPELFWVNQSRRIIAIFTYYNNELRIVDHYWSRCNGIVADNGQLIVSGCDGASENYSTYYILRNGKLENVYRFGMTCPETELYYYEETPEKNVRISENRYDMLSRNSYYNGSNWKNATIFSLHHNPSESDNSWENYSGVDCVPYKQKVARAGQEIYNGPGYSFTLCDNVEASGIYTITSEVTDSSGNLWGRLKSGRGWINLTDVRAPLDNLSITIDTTDKTFVDNNSCYFYDAYDAVSDVYLIFRVNQNITDVSFFHVDTTWVETRGEEYFHLDKMDKTKPLVVRVSFGGSMTTFGISFKDENGKYYSYMTTQNLSGMGKWLGLSEFDG